MVAAVSSSDAKGLYALGILSQEASIIAAKERAEMKMIEFFIPRKFLLLVFTAALNHTAPCAVKRAGIFLIARTTQSSRAGKDARCTTADAPLAIGSLFYPRPWQPPPPLGLSCAFAAPVHVHPDF
jgi:hypothetical protein